MFPSPRAWMRLGDSGEKNIHPTGRDHQQSQSEAGQPAAEWKQLKPETICRSVQVEWQVMPGTGPTAQDSPCVLRRRITAMTHQSSCTGRRRRRRAAVKNTDTLVLFLFLTLSTTRCKSHCYHWGSICSYHTYIKTCCSIFGTEVEVEVSLEGRMRVMDYGEEGNHIKML